MELTRVKREKQLENISDWVFCWISQLVLFHHFFLSHLDPLKSKMQLYPFQLLSAVSLILSKSPKRYSTKYYSRRCVIGREQRVCRKGLTKKHEARILILITSLIMKLFWTILIKLFSYPKNVMYWVALRLLNLGPVW